MRKVEIRDLTENDVVAWYGQSSPYSMRGVVAARGESVLALFGLYRDGGNFVAVAGIGEELREHKKPLVPLIRRAKKILQEYPQVVALRDAEEPTSEGFLGHMGFSRVGITHEGDEVFVWTH